MEKQASARVILSIDAQRTLFMDVCQRQCIEACGVLIGQSDEQSYWHIEQAHPLRNIFDSPVYFEFAPEELLTVELNYPGQIVGVYHSHPTGLAIASSTDRKNMKRVNRDQFIPWVWLIISGPFPDSVTQLHRGRFPEASIVAYHHYEQVGLRQIPIEVEEVVETETQ